MKKIIETMIRKIFGLKRVERLSYLKAIDEFQATISSLREDRESLIKDIHNRRNNTIELNMNYKRITTLNDSANKHLNEFYSRIIPTLSAAQLYELYEIIEPEGWILLRLTKKLTGTNTNNLHYEDNLGCFEDLNGNELVACHENMAFAKVNYETVGTMYEKTIFEKIDTTTDEYKLFTDKRTKLLRKELANLVDLRECFDKEVFNDGFMFLLHILPV
jgi:hypothetical protein